ncbi:MAG: DUF3987 domain-containing protein, partial [Rickettsiales bacterium]
RVTDGATILLGKRFSMHLMVQPGVAGKMLSDSMLLDQGFLSRFLISAPESTAGSRLTKELMPESKQHQDRYHQHLLSILRRPLPTAEGKDNELNPKKLPLSDEAKGDFLKFCDHIEGMLRPGGEMAPIAGLANKLPEHAARIAAVLTLIDDIDAIEVSHAHMQAGIKLAEYYASEGLRLIGEAIVPEDIILAERLLEWLHTSWDEPMISLPDIYQRGLNAIRNKKTAKHIVGILEDHGWLQKMEDGAIVAGVKRREVWEIIRE